MNALPLEWHRATLVDFKANVAREEERLKEQEQKVIRLRNEVRYRELQIAEAERRHKTEFDPDNFLKTQRPFSAD